MKRVLGFLMVAAGAVLLLGGAIVLGANAVWQRAGRVEWPAGLGTLEEVPERFPKREPNADALRLVELAKPLGIDFAKRKAPATATEAAIQKFVETEGVRDVVAIEAPPEPVAAFLAQHAGTIDALAGHLRRSDDIAWTVDLDKGLDAPIPNLVAHMKVMRVLLARALVRARSGDPGAWDDLHAVATLDRSLQHRPDVISQIIALHMARRLNAVAWKLPLPAPAWLAEHHAIDRRRPFLQGVQYDAWTMWRFVPSEYSGTFLRLYLRASVTNLASHQRETAAEVSRVTACGFDAKAYNESRATAIPRWNIVGQTAIADLPWSRVLRYEAEREATANALRVRGGEPVMERSRCSDGAWRYEGGRVAFSRAIAKTNDFDMPLSLLTAR